MKNTIINISSIDPITQYEFIKQVLKEYDREPDFEYPVRLAIQDVFGIEFDIINEYHMGKGKIVIQCFIRNYSRYIVISRTKFTFIGISTMTPIMICKV